MNFKELINKLFKSQEKHYGLALPTDLVSVPMRDSLDDNKIKTLDEYKDNYLEILSQKKHFTSRDIESVDFNDEMLMNFELFGRLVVNHDSDYNLSAMTDYERNALSLKQKVIPRKIKLYIDKMESMFNETHLRLIALKEIYSESGKKLSKDKQNAILNEIYNLTSKYIIFKNNVYAALKEVETYKAEILTSSITKNETIENDVLNMHERDLTSFASYFIPKTYNTIEKSDLDTFDKMAYLERELEIYAYNNLKIDDLNQELEYIDKIEKTPANRKLLLEMINELEIKYLVLNDYGGHELDLKPLYEVKFDILTIDIVKQKDSPFNGIIDRERSYYENIIFDKIATNITGTDSLLDQILDDNNKDIINCFIELLKDNGKYNFYEILHNRFKLCLILSAVSDDQMNYFFDNYLNDLHSSSDMLVSGFYVGSFLSLNDKVPLSTILKINLMTLKGGHDNHPISCSSARIYEYFASKIQDNSHEYRIPEGICAINTFSSSSIEYEVREYLVNKVNGKTLLMPSTLKTLNDNNDIFQNVSIPGIILNEGLENMNNYIPFICNDTKSITIPSTLEELDTRYYAWLNDNHAFNICLEELVFTNYEDSIILHNKKNLRKIIEDIYALVSNDLIKKVKTTKMAQYTEIMIEPRRIILVSKDGDKIQIEVDAIITIEFFKVIKKAYYDMGSYFKSKDILSCLDLNFKEKVIDEIEKKIDEILNNEIKTTNKKK